MKYDLYIGRPEISIHNRYRHCERLRSVDCRRPELAYRTTHAVWQSRRDVDAAVARLGYIDLSSHL